MTGMTRRAARTRRSGVVAVGAVLALVLAACGGGADGSDGVGAGTGDPAWDSVVEAAREEGNLVLATHGGPGYEKFGAAVQEAMADYFDVEVTTIRGSDFAPRVLSEQAAGQYLWDVHVGPGSNKFTALRPANALEPIRPVLESLPEENRRDELWNGGFDFYDSNDGSSFIFELALSDAMMVNRDVVGDAIREPRDLLDPRWRGRIVAYEPTRNNGASMALTWFLNNKEYGPEFVKALLNQDVVYASGSQVSQWLAEGRYAVAIGAQRTEIETLQEAGLGQSVEPLGFGNSQLANTMSLMRNAPHPNASKVFMNWFLSEEGQRAWVENASVTASSRRVGIPPANPETAPDYLHLDQYGSIAGTEAGEAAVQQVIDIARQVGQS